MPPSGAESVAPFRARAHAPARPRALCTSPLLRFVSCPLSLFPPEPSLLTHGITRLYISASFSLFVFSSFFVFVSPSLSLLSFSLSLCLPVSRLRCPPGRRSPVGADILTFPYQNTIPPPHQRNVPSPSIEAQSRAPVVGPTTTSCVYPTLSLPTSVYARDSMCARVPPMHMHARAEPRTRSFRGK